MTVPPGAALRPASASDADAVAAFLAGLSLMTAYRRFHTGLGTRTDAVAARLVAPRSGRHAWVALVDGAVVGLGNAAVDADGRTEVGVVVADAWQGRGLGTRLVEAALFAAAADGAGEVRFVVLGENRRVLAALRRAFPDAPVIYDGGSCELVAPLHEPPRSRSATGTTSATGATSATGTTSAPVGAAAAAQESSSSAVTTSLTGRRGVGAPAPP
jgi:GNAT superfamily N-acetyltransferase